MFESLAYAMGGAAQQGGEGGAGGSFGAFIPLILMFVIFYFLLIRPQQKKAKQHQSMLGGLRKGDRIVTNGGLYGEITGISDTQVTVEIAPKIRVKVARSHVAALASAPQQPAQSAPPDSDAPEEPKDFTKPKE